MADQTHPPDGTANARTHVESKAHYEGRGFASLGQWKPSRHPPPAVDAAPCHKNLAACTHRSARARASLSIHPRRPLQCVAASLPAASGTDATTHNPPWTPRPSVRTLPLVPTASPGQDLHSRPVPSSSRASTAPRRPLPRAPSPTVLWPVDTYSIVRSSSTYFTHRPLPSLNPKLLLALHPFTL